MVSEHGTGTARRSRRLDDTTAREKVLEAAADLYYTRGIQAVGMDALRTASGVSLKRLYTLFPSKEMIVEQVLQRRHDEWNSWVSTATSSGSPRERLLAIYDMLADWFGQDEFRGCMFINSFGELGGTAPRIAEIVRSHKAQFQSTLADLVAVAGAPDELAHQLAILAEGAQTTAAITGTQEPARHAREAAEVLIDNAVRRPVAGTVR